jgi:hypothetical protein
MARYKTESARRQDEIACRVAFSIAGIAFIWQGVITLLG